MTDLHYRVKELEDSLEYWKKQYEKLQDENRKKEMAKAEEERRSSIKIGGYGGIEIPLDKDIKEAISNYVYAEVRKLVEEDKELASKFMKACLNYTDYFKKCFNPLVKALVEDMDFTVRFEPDD